jgi:hypothetical protein
MFSGRLCCAGQQLHYPGLVQCKQLAQNISLFYRVSRLEPLLSLIKNIQYTVFCLLSSFCRAAFLFPLLLSKQKPVTMRDSSVGELHFTFQLFHLPSNGAPTRMKLIFLVTAPSYGMCLAKECDCTGKIVRFLQIAECRSLLFYLHAIFLFKLLLPDMNLGLLCWWGVPDPN